MCIRRVGESAGLFRGGLVGVFPFELLHAAGGVDQLLLPGEERVAVRADLDVNRRLDRPGVIRRSARARNGALHVLRVNPVFHLLRSFSYLVSGISYLAARYASRDTLHDFFAMVARNS